MFEDNVFALDIAEIVERFHQNAQINVFLFGTPGVPSTPTTGILLEVSCARTASGHAAAAPPISVMNCRRFMGFPY